MPTSTFFHLPPAKRERLLQAAAAEFTRKPCGEASINRIIQAAEIPRGSFYQYFADKTDLFRCVLKGYGERMEGVLAESLSRCGGCLRDLPVTSFDLVMEYLQRDAGELQVFLAILRQNLGLDASEMWAVCPLIHLILERADFTGLSLTGPEERHALAELLLGVTGQALAAAACGRQPPGECREHLCRKTALIMRGIEKQEESLCSN